MFHLSNLTENNVCYLCAAETGYPKKLVFQYLEELSREFSNVHGHEVPSYTRPYAAVNFDPRLRRIRDGYSDPQSPNNLKKLHSDLNQIHNVMHQNIQVWFWKERERAIAMAPFMVIFINRTNSHS